MGPDGLVRDGPVGQPDGVPIASIAVGYPLI